MTESSLNKLYFNKKIYLVIYTLLWFAGAAFIYRFFRADGRDMLWMLDGVYQHFPTFSYICDIVENIFHGNLDLTGILPYNYTIGQGADLFTALNSYDFADPFSWVCSSLLFMTRVHRYEVMIFSKLWFTGFAFSVYCFITGRRNTPGVLCGAMAYTFSGSILFMFAMHPNFINWAYFLPLMLGGYELYRQKKQRRLLALSVFFNLLVSFYTFYINALLLALYAVTRSAAAFSKERTAGTLRRELMTDLKAAGVCLIGSLLGAFSLLPTLYAYTQNPRVGGLNGYMDSMFHYGERFYSELLVSLFASNSQLSYQTVLGLLCISMPAVLYFYISFSDDRSGQNRALKLYGMVLLVMLGIPLAGRILNGMSYASNRWGFAIPFVASVMIAASFEGIADCSVLKRLLIAAIGLLYIWTCRSMTDILQGENKDACIVMLLITLAVFVLSGFFGKRVSALSFAALTVLCVFFQSYFIFSPARGNYVSEFEKEQEHDYNYSDSSRTVSGLSTEEDFFRVESVEHTTNVDGINKVNSTDAWWSMYPGSMLDYLSAFEANGILQNCNFEGLFGRTTLLELAAVRYYTSPVSVPDLPPYRYVRSEELSDSDYNVYENTLALPVAYSFRNYIKKSDFDALSAVERQEVLLQGAVLDQNCLDSLPESLTETVPAPEAYELEYKITETNNVELTEDTMTAGADNASVIINAEVPENVELYLQIEGIEIISPDAGNINAVRTKSGADFRKSRTGKISNLSNNWPVTREGITYDLGFGQAGDNKIILRYSKKSRFKYDSIRLWAVPMDSYEARVQELQDHAILNARVNGREISGSVDFPQSRILQFCVPYSIGWTAFLDGQEVPVMNSDILYMAVAVPEGRHEIVMRYRTPYLREGAIVSMVTLLAVLGFSVKNRLSKKSVQ